MKSLISWLRRLGSSSASWVEAAKNARQLPPTTNAHVLTFVILDCPTDDSPETPDPMTYTEARNFVGNFVEMVLEQLPESHRYNLSGDMRQVRLDTLIKCYYDYETKLAEK